MFTTPNMALTAWDLGSDPYDHSQLASNFSKIDDHDHTVGNGVQIPSAGIADLAITGSKIAANAINPLTHIPVASIPQSRLLNDSVGAVQLQDNSVDTGAIIAGAITADKLDPNILPIGTVLMWYRADSAVLAPTGWEVMDGRAWSTITNKLGAGGVQWNTGNIPNMANKFPLGAALAGTGTTPSVPPAIGAVNGQHERDISHTHTAQPHSHVVDAHVHGIASDGAHSHTFTGFSGAGNLFTRDVGMPRAEGTRQALYLPGHNSNSAQGSNVDTPMTAVAAHAHGGSTGSASPATSAVTETINSWASGNLDFRPAHVGLLFIMKVR